MLLKMTSNLAAIVLTGSLAQASMIGTWLGDATFSTKDQVVSTCTVENTVSQTDSTLTFHQTLSGNCSSELEVTLDVQGSDLLQDGAVVGSLTEASLSFLNVSLGSDFYSAVLTANADGTGNFQDRFNYGGAPDDYDGLEGVLTQSPSARKIVPSAQALGIRSQRSH